MEGRGSSDNYSLIVLIRSYIISSLEVKIGEKWIFGILHCMLCYLNFSLIVLGFNL